MPHYIRNRVKGGIYFFTLVTCKRRRFLTTPLARRCLHESIDEERRSHPFDLTAIVLLPDHLHAIWTLPHHDDDYSNRWKRIKKGFTERFLSNGGLEAAVSQSRIRHRERGVWQRRFWEHTCGSDDDRKRCLDYLHYNPVKHGLVARVRDYEWSSFHRYVTLGEYSIDWGEAVPGDITGCEWDECDPNLVG